MAIGTPQKVMLATDLTPAGDRAFDRAVQLSQQWNAELVICHVVESSAVRPWAMDRRMRNADIEMDRLIRTSRTQLRVVRHTVVGDPAERTLEHAQATNCDFLVTGPAHGKVLGDKLLGSTAARIVRRATMPVLAVRRRPEGPYQTIVAAVDFSEGARTALLRGRELFTSAHMTALHAYRVSPNWSGPNADKSIDEIEAAERARVLKEAERDITALIAAAGTSVSPIIPVLEEGEPERALTSYVAANWPDLVVAGTHGRSGFQQDAIGSMAELLLTTLPCDILAVPTRNSVRTGMSSGHRGSD